ncbi:MAG: 3-deoxy-7-phosphoheptulonate synthase [Acidobacteriota bacterium]
MSLPGVAAVAEGRVKHPLASSLGASSEVVVSRTGHEPVVFGGELVPLIAGPCSVESEEQVLGTAQAVAAAGARLLRGGAYKPRTSPYSFQGLGREGLELLALAREATGLLVVTEALDPRDVELVARHADMVQVGTRNMSSFTLLQEVGSCGLPVLLKRGFSSTLEEWLLAAEYVLDAGCPGLVLCERGVRTFGDHARFVLDLNIIPAAQTLSHLPVMADPSHSTGRRDCVEPLARAAVAVGADAVMLEVHPRPEDALSDGAQALLPEDLTRLTGQLDAIARSLGRRVLDGEPPVQPDPARLGAARA